MPRRKARRRAAQAGRLDARPDGTPVWVWYDRDGVSFGSPLADAVVEEVARARLGAPAVRPDGDNNGCLYYAAASLPLPYATPSPAASPRGCCWHCGAVEGDSVAGGRVFFEPDPDDRGGGYVVEQQICQAADCRRASAIRRRRAGRDPLPKTDCRGRTAHPRPGGRGREEDGEQVALCRAALAGDADARAECARVIAEAPPLTGGAA